MLADVERAIRLEELASQAGTADERRRLLLEAYTSAYRADPATAAGIPAALVALECPELSDADCHAVAESEAHGDDLCAAFTRAGVDLPPWLRRGSTTPEREPQRRSRTRRPAPDFEQSTSKTPATGTDSHNPAGDARLTEQQKEDEMDHAAQLEELHALKAGLAAMNMSTADVDAKIKALTAEPENRGRLAELKTLRAQLTGLGFSTGDVDSQIAELEPNPEEAEKEPSKAAAADIVARSEAVDAGSTAFSSAQGPATAGATPFGSVAIADLLPPKGKHNGEISRASARISTNDLNEPRLWATVGVELDGSSKLVTRTFLVGASERELAESEGDWARRRHTEDRAQFDRLLTMANVKPATYDHLIEIMPELIGMRVGVVVSINTRQGAADLRTIRAPYLPEELPQR